MSKFFSRLLIRGHIGLLVLFPLCSQAGGGGEKFQLSVLASPTIEWVHFRGGELLLADSLNDLYSSKFSYNFGLEYKHFFSPFISFSTGLQYHNKGFRNVEPYALPGATELTEEGITVGSAHYLLVPLDLNLHIGLSRKTFLLFSGGLSGGRAVLRTINNRNYTDEVDPTNGGLFSGRNGKSNTTLFNRNFIGLNTGVGVSQHIKARVTLDFQLQYRYQLNRAFDDGANTTVVTRAKFNSLALECKLGWYFSRQIQGGNKEF